MPPSATTTTQLGRHFWVSILDSANTLPGRAPRRQLLGIGQHSRLIHSSRRPFPAPQPQVPPHNSVRRSCTSGGLLLVGLGSSPSLPGSVISTCTVAAESALSGNGTQKANISQLARQAWAYGHRTGDPHDGRISGKRAMSLNTKRDGPKNDIPSSQKTPIPDQKSTDKTPPSDPHLSEHETLADSVSKYLHLPKMPHRPTKEELLAAASGFWERLKVRFKWFSIRSMRPWNADEWGAFVSWFLLGHLVWILVGTTTFFSLIILFINTVFAQGEYLTHLTRVWKRGGS